MTGEAGGVLYAARRIPVISQACSISGCVRDRKASHKNWTDVVITLVLCVCKQTSSLKHDSKLDGRGWTRLASLKSVSLAKTWSAPFASSRGKTLWSCSRASTCSAESAFSGWISALIADRASEV